MFVISFNFFFFFVVTVEEFAKWIIYNKQNNKNLDGILQKGVYPDLLATTGDYLRLWRLDGENGAKLEVRLNNVGF